MRKLLYQINRILNEKLFIKDKNNILCAISGGQDSIFLFILLLHFTKQYNLKLKILYCHHFWQDGNFTCFWLIWKIAFIFKVPFYMILTEKSIVSENRARTWRQETYQRITSFFNDNKVILGHTASDRIETAFWHLIRGTSLRGITSTQWENNLQQLSLSPYFPDLFFLNLNQNIIISKTDKKRNYSPNKFLKKKIKTFAKISHFSRMWKQGSGYKNSEDRDYISRMVIQKNHYLFGLPLDHNSTDFYRICFLVTKFLKLDKKIIRPLLGLHRADITKIIRFSRLPLLNDLTNQQLKSQRNKIRYQVLPTLRYSFNPQVDYLINQFLEISTEELSLLHNFNKFFFNIQFLKEINPIFFEKLPFCVQREIVLKVFFKAHDIFLVYSQIENIRSSLCQKKNEVFDTKSKKLT